MLQLCYVSRATVAFSERMLTTMLAGARARNQRRGVTGLLVYKDGSFMQLIEGPDPVVIALYNKIRRDPRHTDASLLFKELVDQRSFEDWHMGFVDGGSEALASLPGYADIFSATFEPARFRKDGDRARLVFLQFKDGLWHRPVNVVGSVCLSRRVAV